MSYERMTNHFMEYEPEDLFLDQMIGPYNFMYDKMNCQSYSVNNNESQGQPVNLDIDSEPINQQFSYVLKDDPAENAQNELSLQSLDFDLYEDSAIKLNPK